MKVILMGSSRFAVGIFSFLLDTRSYAIKAVYTTPPKPSGRGYKIRKSPVHIIAEKNNIEVCFPVSLRSLVERERFKSFKPDIAIVAAYGLIIPREIFSIPKYGCINIHPSLLPRWRGPAPIQHAILAGDCKTGISIIQLNEELDSGPILGQKKIIIENNDNYKTLHDKLSELGSCLLIEILSKIEVLIPLEQNISDASCYANKIEDYMIYANDTCVFAWRKVRAFYPKAFIKIWNKRFRILDADFELGTPFNSSTLCKIINSNLYISFRDGILIPKLVQMEGRNPCNITDFIHGLRLEYKALIE